MHNKEGFTPPEFNPDSLNSDFSIFPQARACTRSYFCSSASTRVFKLLARKTGLTVDKVKADAVQTNGTLSSPARTPRMGPNNLTGATYRLLVRDGIIDVSCEPNGHACLVRS